MTLVQGIEDRAVDAEAFLDHAFEYCCEDFP